MTSAGPPGVPWIETRLELAGVETRSLEVEGEGPPFLLLHGFADSADCWRALLPLLAGAGRTATAIDLTGFGTATAIDLERPMLAQWDRLVAAAIERLSERSGGGEVLISGNSLGGALAMRAAQNPDLPIGGVVPIAPAGLQMARWLPLIEGERLIRLLRLSPLPVPELVVREVVGRVYRTLVFGDPRAVDDAVVSSFTRHIPTVARGTQILETGRRLLPELEDPFDLSRIECPLLLVWGDRDRMVYTTGAERVLRAVDYSDIEVIERCGHCPQIEVPERMAELLLDFPEMESLAAAPDDAWAT